MPSEDDDKDRIGTQLTLIKMWGALYNKTCFSVVNHFHLGLFVNGPNKEKGLYSLTQSPNFSNTSDKILFSSSSSSE